MRKLKKKHWSLVLQTDFDLIGGIFAQDNFLPHYTLKNGLNMATFWKKKIFGQKIESVLTLGDFSPK